MIRRLAILIACIVALPPAAMVSAQSLTPAPATTPALPQSFIPERLSKLDMEIADRTTMMKVADVAERAMLQAERNLLLVARQLLAVGQASGENGSIALMYGLTIANHADQLHQVIEPLPKMVVAALRAQPADTDEVARLSKIVEALKQFNERCDKGIASLKTADADTVDRYLQQLLSPLAIVVTGMNQPRPGDTWATGERATTQARRGERVALEDFAPLGKRFSATELADETKVELRRMIGLCERGWQEADLRPLVAGFYHQLATVADVVETFSRATWLDGPSFDRFQRQVHASVMMLGDPRTRDSAIARLQELSRVQQLMKRINALSQTGKTVPIDPLRELFIVAHDLHSQPDRREAAEQLIRLLERVVTTAAAYRQINKQVLPADIQRSFQLTSRQYEHLEQQLFVLLPVLTEDPADAARPQWSNMVTQLERQERLLEQLNAIPEWVTRMSAFNPLAGQGMYKQLRQIARDVVKPDAEAGAAATLDELDKQLTLFEKLPYEDQLNATNSPLRQFTGEYHEALSQQIVLLRSQWAAAWGLGSDPTEAGRHLLLIRRLLQASGDGAKLIEASATMAQLNRWAAWEIETTAVDPLKAWLPARLQLACRLGATGQWEPLEGVLKQIEHQGPVGRVVARLSRTLAPALGDVPGGLSGMLGQCLYPPSPGAFGSNDRPTLAALSVYLTAAEFARDHGQPRAAQELMTHCGQLSRSLLQQWEGAPPQLAPPPTAPPAPTPSPDSLDI